MEIREFAELVLHSASLEDKLLVPERFTDVSPHFEGELPATPGRPAGLSFSPQKPTFPHHLERPTERAVALHFFANHELMALELMALALLKFTDAPPAFRLGIAQTMLEEQQHFTGYRERAEALGVGFGDVALGSFFWDALSVMRTPMDYVTQLSMTFEQANLDYAHHYAQRFDLLGDPESAAIMRVVHDDEVGHLAFGVSWFERWRDPEQDLWSAYRDSLPAPLSPSWAKGIGFREQARRDAGLGDAFIRQLRVYARSKGRPPSVFLFNPNGDSAGQRRELRCRTAEEVTRARQDLAPLLLFVASPSDLVIAERPSLPFLERLEALGIALPELGDEALLARHRHVAALEPWAWDDEAQQLERSLGETLREKHRPPSDEARQLGATLQREAAAAAGAADALVELSFHATVTDKETKSSRAGPRMLRVLRDSSGLLRGHRVTKPWRGLEQPLVQYLCDRHMAGGAAQLNMFDRALGAQRELREAGYRGPLSLHFGVHADDKGFRFELLEVHQRPTLGCVALALQHLVVPWRPAIWVVLDRAEVKSSPADFCEELQRRFPLEIVQGRQGVRIAHGVLPTTDPSRCNDKLTLLVVGDIELPTLTAQRG